MTWAHQEEGGRSGSTDGWMMRVFHDVKKPTLRSVDLVEIGRADVVCIKHPEDGGRRHISIPESRSAFGEPQER